MLLAAPKPDFSGTWKLNVARSDFGKTAPPTAMVTRIEQNGPGIVVHSHITGPQGTYDTDYKWVADGRENVNVIRGNEIHTSVVWNGPNLVSTAKATINGLPLTIVDQWALSSDKKTLTVSRSLISPQGTAEQSFVYEK
ncbi:MAG: hypothetical protein JO022_02415 [Acidobacteriaceae bacterium]|nr:hypothetical protein [Acidobacteriaceae bacterium]